MVAGGVRFDADRRRAPCLAGAGRAVRGGAGGARATRRHGRWGVAIAIGVPVLAILALVTLVGIPFGVALLLAAIPVLLVAYATAAWIMGRRVLRNRSASPWAALFAAGESCECWPSFPSPARSSDSRRRSWDSERWPSRSGGRAERPRPRRRPRRRLRALPHQPPDVGDSMLETPARDDQGEPDCEQTPASDVSDSLGDGDPERLPRPEPPVTAPRRCLGAVLRRARGRGRMARRVALRAKVDLTVSGLKSDSPPRIGIAGSAPAGVRAQEHAVCRKSRPTAAAGGTLDLLQACRMTSVRTSENRPANRAFSLKPPTIGGPRVRNQSDRMQRNKATAPNEKDLQIRPFREAADGIRTHDLLHGKQ